MDAVCGASSGMRTLSDVPSLTKTVSTTALAALGALVIHQLAYLFAFPLADIRAARLAGHEHLSTQWALVTPLAVVAASTLILRQIKHLRLGSDLRAGPLAALSGLFFLAQETIEAATQGVGIASTLANPATTIGLLLAPFVGLAFVGTLHRATELVAGLLATPAAVSFPQVSFPRPTDERRSSDRLVLSTSPRGPPVLAS